MAIITTLTTIGMVYYAFFKQPNKLMKLNKDIAEAISLKQSLIQNINQLSTDKSQLLIEFNKVIADKDHLQEEWKKLSNLIGTGNQKLQAISYEKQKVQSDLQTIKAEIEKLKAAVESNKQKTNQTRKELVLLTDQNTNLQSEINSLQKQLQQMKKEASDLSEHKSDLENENSHLSLEIAKKKISYGTLVGEYDDVEGDKRSVKHIGYIPNNNFSKECFPYVSMPKHNSVIKFPRKGRLGQRGYIEPTFEEELKTYFLRQRKLQLFSDRFLCVSNNTKPYEPDFTLIDERNNLNLFIDIEIDEPYDSIGRYATHYKGLDEYRNQYFNDRGWIVIRFSEKQVYESPKGCCRLIAEVIKSINTVFIIPQELQSISVVPEEPFWSKVKAEKWSKGNYRELYLGTTFSEKIKVIVDTTNLYQNESEKTAEKSVAPTALEVEKRKGKINELNRHHRDSRIKFFPEPHIYLIDDNPRTISASTLIKRFFPDFDDDYWAEIKANQKGITAQKQKDEWIANTQRSAALGTQLHLDIEKYFESNKTIIPENKIEFEYFLDFYEKHLTDLKLYRTEWRIFDDLIYVAGTADMIFKKGDGTYAIYDWKRSKEIRKYNPFNKGIGVCNDLDDCNYIHYCLQLNIYKKILEDYYAKPVSEMYFVQLHPDFDTYKVFKVPDMRQKVEKMFDELIN